MSDYRKVRDAFAEQHDATAGADALPCHYCGTSTDRTTLTNLGARCRACFEQFQRLGYSGGQPPREAGQAPWVRKAAAEVRARAGAEPMPGLEALSSAIAKRRAQRQQLAGMSVDEVNAELATGGR